MIRQWWHVAWPWWRVKWELPLESIDRMHAHPFELLSRGRALVFGCLAAAVLSCLFVIMSRFRVQE